MLARFRIAWESLRSSLWALPLTMAAIAAALSVVSVNFRLPDGVEIDWIFGGSTSSAREFAASLVSAMITLTALAFSITMVVLTLAAQQLGPRLIRAFMSDRKTQLALGLFLGTVVYLVLVLRTLDGSEGATTPHVAITIGTALVLASVIVLLLFVHWLARSIMADHVIARVGATLDYQIDNATRDEPAIPPDPVAATLAASGEPLLLGLGGYIQNVDHHAIVGIAKEAGLKVVLDFRAGDHLLSEEAIGRVEGDCDDDIRRALAGAIVVGQERTQGQDPGWSVRQLVEVALRALSSGINDEYTAVAVLDRLAQSLARMAQLPPPREVWIDGEGEARLVAPAAGFAELVRTAIDPIRSTARGDGRILEHLARMLARLWKVAPAAYRTELGRQGELLRATARRTLSETVELDAIERVIAAMRD